MGRRLNLQNYNSKIQGIRKPNSNTAFDRGSYSYIIGT